MKTNLMINIEKLLTHQTGIKDILHNTSKYSFIIQVTRMFGEITNLIWVQSNLPQSDKIVAKLQAKVKELISDIIV